MLSKQELFERLESLFYNKRTLYQIVDEYTIYLVWLRLDTFRKCFVVQRDGQIAVTLVLIDGTVLQAVYQDVLDCAFLNQEVYRVFWSNIREIQVLS